MKRKELGITPHPKSNFVTTLADANPSLDKFDLWHYRLGHTSHLVAEKIHYSYPNVVLIKDRICEICHQAKQKKLPFPSHETNTNKPFDLLQIDTWSLYSVCALGGYQYFLTIVDDY